MRRIFYLYIITHIESVVPFFPPSPPLVPFSCPSHRYFFPFLASRFPRSLVLPVSLSATRFPSRRVYLFYFIIKQTPLPVILAPTYVFTRTHGIHVKHSLHLTRGSAYATVPDTKNIFSLPSSHSRYHSPFHVSRALSESLRWALIATLKGIFHLKGTLYAFEAHLKTQEYNNETVINAINTCMPCYIKVY